MLRSDFLREASDPTKPSQAFHAGRPGKPRPISALQPVMLTVRRLAAEVRFRVVRVSGRDNSQVMLTVRRLAAEVRPSQALVDRHRCSRGCGTCQTSDHHFMLQYMHGILRVHSFTAAECALSAHVRPSHARTSCTRKKTQNMAEYRSPHGT